MNECQPDTIPLILIRTGSVYAGRIRTQPNSTRLDNSAPTLNGSFFANAKLKGPLRFTDNLIILRFHRAVFQWNDDLFGLLFGLLGTMIWNDS